MGRGSPLIPQIKAIVNASNLTRVEATTRAELITDIAYDIELDVTPGDVDTFSSITRVTFEVTGAGVDTFLDLAAPTVEAVLVNGRDVADAYRDGRVHLSDLSGRNEVVVRARCAYSRSGVGLHRFVDPSDGEVFLYTQFEPQDAHRVYACFDQPDLKARIRLAVHAPADWEVISNAAVETRPADGTGGRWTFAETLPIPTYISAVVAGPFHRVTAHHRGVDLGVYCRESMAGYLDPDEIFDITRQGLDYFTEAFGYPYPFGKYDQLFVPEFNFGAMENPGCVTFSESYIYRSRVTQAARLSRANTILHEMAHMWFGDLVTMKWWNDLWLNESFATFMAHTAVADATRFGRDAWADFAHSMKAWAYQQDQLPSTHPIVAEIVDTESVMANFDGITYAKGASVLKQLHAWVGPDAFLDGLRTYFPRHEYGNAELADFLRVLEDASGRDLQDWAGKWLQTAGVATLSADIAQAADGTLGSVAIIQVAQPGHPTLRPHRLAIGLYDTIDGRLTRVDRVEVDIDGPSTTIAELAGRPRPELLLLNDDDLTYAKLRLDPVSVATLELRLGSMSDGVARALCWGALWDATRDGELAARRFAGLVCEHGPVEEDISVLQTLLRQAFSCADRYGDPANAEAIRTMLAAVAEVGLNAAEPGGDRQLVWARARVASRVDPAFGLALLDGSTVVESLPIEQDLRWFILSHLTATGDVDAEQIAAELDRDPTDLGRRAYEAAMAARPDAEAKSEAWAKANDRSLAMHTRRAVLRGFWQVGQDDLLMEYATHGWVDLLPELWDNVSAEEGLTMTEAYYPAVLVADDVVAAADRALASEGLTELARRTVGENRDGTQRALRARAVDAQG